MSQPLTSWSRAPFLAQAASPEITPSGVALHTIADALIAICFFGMAAALLYFVVRRRMAFPSMFALLALFLTATGLVHMFAALSVAPEEPWMSDTAKVLSAGAGIASAFTLVRAIRAMLQLPTRAELHKLNVSLEAGVASRTRDLTAANEDLRREAGQREQAEAEVRRLNAELHARLAEVESLFNLLPVGVAIASDASCKQIRTNPAFAEMLGLPMGRNASLSAPADEAPRNFHVLHEGQELSPDELPIQRAIRTGVPVRDFEETIVRNDGITLEVIANAVPLRDAEGRVNGCVATFLDISVHKHAERQRLDFERKFLQSQKLESIGMLAGGIAHDFNNLLTGILGHANFARTELARGSTSIDHLLAQVENSAQRAAELCRQLLAYAGKGRFVVRMIDLNVAVQQALPLLRLSIAKKVNLELELAPALPPFRGDPTQVNQILLNLVTNASEAIGTASGTVTIRTERVALTPLDMLTLTTHQEIEPGSFVCLSVRDTGCGITPEAMGHIFEPFFTTKFVGRGLGLAAVLGIVHGHRGAIRVNSQVGAGTTFELFFPVVAVPPRASGPPAPAGSGTVLVVDDEDTVRSFAATVLAAAGYAVVSANDGEDALAKLKRDPVQFDAVLLDLTMPKLDGEDTLVALRMLAPNLPVVLTSGHSEHMIAQRFVGRGLADFLPKPFMSEALLASISSAIARTRGNT